MGPHQFGQRVSNPTNPILVACPACQQPGFMDTWSFIDSTWQEPHDLLVGGRLFKYVCPVCNKETAMGYTCVYRDKARKVLIICELDPDKAEPACQAVDKLAQDLEQKEELVAHTYQRRVVTSGFEFCEKVRLLDEGYDDRVIELMKLAIKRGMLEEGIIGPYDRLIFERTMPDGQISYVVTGDIPGDVVGKRGGYDYMARYLAEQEEERTEELAHEYRFNSAWARSFLP